MRAVCCGMVCVFIHVLGYSRMIFVRESVWFIQLIVFVHFSFLVYFWWNQQWSYALFYVAWEYDVDS